MAQLIIKYKTTVAFLHKSGLTNIDTTLFQIMPESKFGFVTFEADDFEWGTITYLLFNFVPDSICVTVGNAIDLDSAVDEVRKLNAHVSFECLPVSEVVDNTLMTERKSQELVMIHRVMQVNRDGLLIQ